MRSAWIVGGTHPAASSPVPRRRPRAQEAVVDHHRQQLLDEERVALAPPRRFARARRPRCRRRRQVVDDLRARRAESGVEREVLELLPGRVGFSSTSGRATQRRSAGARLPSRHVVDEIEQRRLGPVKILEHEHERPAARRASRRACRAAQNISGSGYCRVRGRSPRRAARTTPSLPSPRARRASPARRREVVAVLDARRLPQRLDERPEGDPIAVGKAPPADDERVLGGGRADVLDETGLAHARIAGDQHARRRGRRPRARVLPRSLRFVPRGQPARPLVLGGPPIVHLQQAECGNTLRLAFQLERLDRLDLDVLADEPVRQLSEENLARRGRPARVAPPC